MIFERDERVFTFSMHQQHNYPMFKPRSDLDIGLEDGAGDQRYLSLLTDALPRVFDSGPDLVVYLAGADPFEGDRLGLDGGSARTGIVTAAEIQDGRYRILKAGVPFAVPLSSSCSAGTN